MPNHDGGRISQLLSSVRNGMRKRLGARMISPLLIVLIVAVVVAGAAVAMTSFVTANDSVAVVSETSSPSAEDSSPAEAETSAPVSPSPTPTSTATREEEVVVYLVAEPRAAESGPFFEEVRRRVMIEDGPLPVERRIELTLRELLAGPTPSELDRGLSSMFTAQTAGMLNLVRLEPDGKAVVDFRNFSPLIPSASTAAGSENFLGQLNRTMFQFPEVKNVTYSFDGSCEDFWLNWLGSECDSIERE